MSAETLRRAAARMRERASVAPVAPWSAEPIGSEGYAVLSPQLRPGGLSRINVARCRIEEWATDRASAEHIASWHPAVALAVADSLIAAAAHVESYDCEAHCEPDGCELVLTATRTARTYLNESA